MWPRISPPIFKAAPHSFDGRRSLIAPTTATAYTARHRNEYWSQAESEKCINGAPGHTRPVRRITSMLSQVPSLLRSQTPPLHASSVSRDLMPFSSPKVDVMVLYSTEAWSNHAMTEQQLLTNIAAGFQTSDAAMVNSAVNLQFNLVHVGQVSVGWRAGRVVWLNCRECYVAEARVPSCVYFEVAYAYTWSTSMRHCARKTGVGRC